MRDMCMPMPNQWVCLAETRALCQRWGLPHCDCRASMAHQRMQWHYNVAQVRNQHPYLAAPMWCNNHGDRWCKNLPCTNVGVNSIRTKPFMTVLARLCVCMGLHALLHLSMCCIQPCCCPLCPCPDCPCQVGYCCSDLGCLACTLVAILPETLQ